MLMKYTVHQQILNQLYSLNLCEVHSALHDTNQHTYLHMTVMALFPAPISTLVTLSTSASREELEGKQPCSGLRN